MNSDGINLPDKCCGRCRHWREATAVHGIRVGFLHGIRVGFCGWEPVSRDYLPTGIALNRIQTLTEQTQDCYWFDKATDKGADDAADFAHLTWPLEEI